jgi:twinkle protein
VNLLDDSIDFDAYFADQQDEAAHVKPASSWADAVIDRIHGAGAPANWTPTGFAKCDEKFELRPGELTIWAGINGHGKTTLLSQVMLSIIGRGQKVCLASLEMKPAETMAKMSRQAAGSERPSVEFIGNFHRWTDGRLWVYDHVGRIAASRVLAVATYIRKELGIDHLVVDSLMKCGIGTDDYTAQRDFVDGLCAICRDTGLSIHLVAHMRKGENERTAPGKFDVKGAGEITDLVDNLVIVWRNLRKDDKPETPSTDPDAYMRVAKQRHHSWEGSFAFWFDKPSQQFLEFEHQRPTFVEVARAYA